MPARWLRATACAFKMGEMTGKAKLILESGDVMEGNFEGGVLTGEGVLYDHSYNPGAVYRGTFSGGGLNGKGSVTYADGDKYEGDWDQNRKHGFGKFVHAEDGETYEGQFVNNERSGRGKLSWPDGTVFEAPWVHDALHGKGTISGTEGVLFDAKWERGEVVWKQARGG